MQIGDNRMKNVEKKPIKKCREILSREMQETEPVTVPPALLGELQSLIESARVRVAVGVNAGMVIPYPQNSPSFLCHVPETQLTLRSASQKRTLAF